MGASSSSSRRDRTRFRDTPLSASSLVSFPSGSTSTSTSASASTSTSTSITFSSCNCTCTCPPSSRSSTISPTLTPHGSRTPSMPIPRHGKGNIACPHNHMHKFSSRMKRLFRPHEHTMEDETVHDITEEYPESSLYRQFQSPIRVCNNPTHAALSQSRSVPLTIHIQPTTKTSIQQDESGLSLEEILATRTASHGLFDAYPYHAFDAFLLRTHPTLRPCLCFLHAEQSFREKWNGFTPYHTSHTCKICIMITDAKRLYQTYLIPIKPFLSIEVISRLEDVGLNSTSPNQDMDVIPFIHAEMFSQAVHDIMHTLRTGPFQHFIQTRQYQELAIPSPDPRAHSTSTLIAA